MRSAFSWLCKQPSDRVYWDDPRQGNAWLCALTDERSRRPLW